LIERLRGDPAFAKVRLERVMRPEAYVGLAPKQVDEFLSGVVRPILRRWKGGIQKPEIGV
jgi:adenylosuccinate lyase